MSHIENRNEKSVTEKFLWALIGVRTNRDEYAEEVVGVEVF